MILHQKNTEAIISNNFKVMKNKGELEIVPTLSMSDTMTPTSLEETRIFPFKNNNSNHIFSFIDLFAGIGGFRIAMQNCGGKCVFSSEWNEKAKQTYYENFGDIPYGDITLKSTKDNIPNNFDLLCGGFPCQPFSICGKKLGFEDTRGTLFFDVCEILKNKHPQCVLLENVQHLTKHDKGRTFRVILNSLLDLGYNVSYKVLNANDFGVPQSRERIFIVGSRNGMFNFDKIRKLPKNKLESIIDMSDNHEFLDDSEYTLLDKSLVKQQSKSGLIFCGYRNKGLWKNGIRENTEHLSRCHRQPNRIYSIEGIHPTLPSQETSGRFFIYIPKKNKVRKLTIDECYRLMGFPDNYIKNNNIGEQYRQIGNSVAVPVIQAIVESMIEQGLLTNKILTDEKQQKNGNGRGHLQGEQFKLNF